MMVQDILDATGALLVRGDPRAFVHGVSTDTRALKPRELFLALSGPNFDGNQFAEEAMRAGAGALLLENKPGRPLPRVAGELPVALHEAPRRALSDLASWHRSRIQAQVIAITGSCGKTTTKGILAQLLSAHFETVASPSSFNNDIGVPHTILLADPETRMLVVEIGTNGPGEIAALSRIARPTVGIITNIGNAHLAGLGSIEGVLREKSDLFASLPRGGTAVLNLDCRFARELRAATSANVVTFSVEGGNDGDREAVGDFNAERPWFHAAGTTFSLRGHEITSPLLGVHNISNLLAAIAACEAVGLSLEQLLPSISRLRGGRRRMERLELQGIVVFDDTYNATPESARAGLRVLAGLHGHKRRVVILGDMLELGPRAPELHHAMGRDAAEAGVDQLLLVGELTRASAAGALEAGLSADRVHHLGGREAALAAVAGFIREGDVVLVKGSNAMGMDRVVRHLGECFGPAAN
ncbi:MAG TPA: UDP-N-acetylmuramoyl-tripeptide--D-alanyl-D-alanine ligase [Planctomycetota bacterium]|nr:UDP-N-acetylmuramoyl-tripeptide--D-alanyl-D-alanine ligase [Planctomycetota bacterium]